MTQNKTTSIMYFAARSFTLPPGFSHSHFPHMSQPVAADGPLRRIKDVFPTPLTVKGVEKVIRDFVCEYEIWMRFTYMSSKCNQVMLIS